MNMNPTPSINVNLKPCTCHHRDTEQRADDHPYPCSSAPILIPCPIPRTVTITVRLGECDYPRDACRFGHLDGCRAYPIRVTCSITGKTWAMSEVADVDHHAVVLAAQPGLYAQILNACRERWALVKALVLGSHVTDPIHAVAVASGATLVSLFAQRDAVFSALADMARAEETVWQAQELACRTMEATFIPDNFMNEEPHSRPSASILERYVERLIEQVGGL